MIANACVGSGNVCGSLPFIRAAGIAPVQFADRNSAAFRDITGLLNISHDDFIRTTEDRHIRGVQALWQELERRGEIYLTFYENFCVDPENEIRRICAHLGEKIDDASLARFLARLRRPSANSKLKSEMLDGWKIPHGMTCNIPPATATLPESRLWRTNVAPSRSRRMVNVSVDVPSARRLRSNGLPRTAGLTASKSRRN